MKQEKIKFGIFRVIVMYIFLPFYILYWGAIMIAYITSIVNEKADELRVDES